MDSIYEKLFEGYAIPVLQDLDRYYDEEALTAQLERLALSKDTSSQLEELFYDCYLQCHRRLRPGAPSGVIPAPR